MTKNLINVNKPTIGVIDTGTSNIKSVYYALIESNAHVVEIKNSSDTKRTIQALVVPGIGSFGFVMQNLETLCIDLGSIWAPFWNTFGTVFSKHV